METYGNTKIHTWKYIVAFFIVLQLLSGERIDYSSIKRKGLLTVLTTWIIIKCTLLIELIWTKKAKYNVWLHVYDTLKIANQWIHIIDFQSKRVEEEYYSAMMRVIYWYIQQHGWTSNTSLYIFKKPKNAKYHMIPFIHRKGKTIRCRSGISSFQKLCLVVGMHYIKRKQSEFWSGL